MRSTHNDEGGTVPYLCVQRSPWTPWTGKTELHNAITLCLHTLVLGVTLLMNVALTAHYKTNNFCPYIVQAPISPIKCVCGHKSCKNNLAGLSVTACHSGTAYEGLTSKSVWILIASNVLPISYWTSSQETSITAGVSQDLVIVLVSED